MDIVSQEILDTTQNIDYGCEFSNGTCVGMTKRLERGLKDIGKVCCRACAHNVGYLNTTCPELPPEYLAYFDSIKGFWTENGCGLPREMRSRRCVIYVCRDANISDSDRAILKHLEETT